MADLEAEITGDETDDKKKPEKGLLSIPTDMKMNKDGSYEIELPEENEEEALSQDDSQEQEEEHFTNLAEQFNDVDLSAMAIELVKLIETDRDDRKKQDTIYAEALALTGLSGKEDAKPAVNGMSLVKHPMVMEACIDFSARVSREMLPIEGPCRESVLGDKTQEKTDRAQRVARHMNYQLTREITSFTHEMEQNFTQQPLAGGAYMKLWADGKGVVHIEFVPLDYVYRPYTDDEFYKSARITHEQHPTLATVEQRMESGLYREIELSSSAIIPEKSMTDAKSDGITGKTDSGLNEMGARIVYESSVMLKLPKSTLDNGYPGDDEPQPYIVSIDEATKQFLAIYRNWDKDDDEAKERLDFLIEFGFWPWRGGRPIGLAQIMGGLPASATGALRALLDAAMVSNFPGMLKLKSGTGGQNIQPQPMTLTEIENSTMSDDIRKVVMAIPYKEPSNVLYQLLGFLVDAGKGLVRTTFDDLLEKGRSDVPVGTMMAVIEQGSVVFSSVFARQHRAMQRLLNNLYRINKRIVEDEEVMDKFGELIVTQKDYEGASIVVPASDPRVFSEAQRWAQVQMVAQRAQLLPQLYKLRDVELMLLKQARIENGEALLADVPTPHEMNAINENVACSYGKPITAMPNQDHLSHLEAHLDFLKSPLFGMNRMMAPKILPAMLQHIQEHMVLQYAQAIMEATSAAMSTVKGHEVDVTEMFKEKDKTLSALLDKLFAEASGPVMDNLAKTFAQIPQIVAPAMQLLQSLQPPMPMDPSNVMQLETKRKEAADQAKNTLENAKLQLAQKEGETDQAFKERQFALEASRAGSEDDTKRRNIELSATQIASDARMKAAAIQQKGEDMDKRVGMNTADNETAKQIVAFEAATGEKSNLSTGTGVNPGT